MGCFQGHAEHLLNRFLNPFSHRQSGRLCDGHNQSLKPCDHSLPSASSDRTLRKGRLRGGRLAFPVAPGTACPAWREAPLEPLSALGPRNLHLPAWTNGEPSVLRGPPGLLLSRLPGGRPDPPCASLSSSSSEGGVSAGRGRTDGLGGNGGCGCSARVPRRPDPLGPRLLEMLFLAVSGRGCGVRSSALGTPLRSPGWEGRRWKKKRRRRRKEPGHPRRPGVAWMREGRAKGADQARFPGLLPVGHVDPRLRSMFQLHAGAWERWCCCCLIPADLPWDGGRRWRLDMAGTRSVHETRFEAAVKVIQSLPKNGGSSACAPCRAAS